MNLEYNLKYKHMKNLILILMVLMVCSCKSYEDVHSTAILPTDLDLSGRINVKVSTDNNSLVAWGRLRPKYKKTRVVKFYNKGTQSGNYLFRLYKRDSIIFTTTIVVPIRKK